MAQGFPGESLIDLDQIYYAACDNPVPIIMPKYLCVESQILNSSVRVRDLIPKMNIDFLCP